MHRNNRGSNRWNGIPSDGGCQASTVCWAQDWGWGATDTSPSSRVERAGSIGPQGLLSMWYMTQGTTCVASEIPAFGSWPRSHAEATDSAAFSLGDAVITRNKWLYTSNTRSTYVKQQLSEEHRPKFWYTDLNQLIQLRSCFLLDASSVVDRLVS